MVSIRRQILAARTQSSLWAMNTGLVQAKKLRNRTRKNLKVLIKLVVELDKANSEEKRTKVMSKLADAEGKKYNIREAVNKLDDTVRGPIRNIARDISELRNARVLMDTQKDELKYGYTLLGREIKKVLTPKLLKVTKAQAILATLITQKIKDFKKIDIAQTNLKSAKLTLKKIKKRKQWSKKMVLNRLTKLEKLMTEGSKSNRTGLLKDCSEEVRKMWDTKRTKLFEDREKLHHGTMSKQVKKAKRISMRGKLKKYNIMRSRCAVRLVEDYKRLDDDIPKGICQPETRRACILRHVELIKLRSRGVALAKEALRSLRQNHPTLPHYALEVKVKQELRERARLQVSLKKCKDTVCPAVEKVKVVTKRPKKPKFTIKCAPGYVYNGRIECELIKKGCTPITKKGCA